MEAKEIMTLEGLIDFQQGYYINIHIWMAHFQGIFSPSICE